MCRHDYSTEEPRMSEQVRLRAIARRLLARRAAREGFLPGSLFGEAGWDALLWLFADEFKPLSLPQLADSANVTVAQMRRWLDYLLQESLIGIEGHTSTGGPDRFRLSNQGKCAVQEYLQQYFPANMIS